MADRVGQQLGNYRLTRLIGQGGFGEVYLSEHIYLKTQAAIKVLQLRLANEDMESFLKEARTIASLKHLHIVRVLDFGVDTGVPYLVMDYAPHGTLRQRHPKNSRLPLTEILPYVRQIADALQYAHDHKLIHRDIKPENMLLGENNEILLSDFGIALMTQSSRYQSTQEVVGTVAYMAPEQLQGHPRPASDQYALGIVAYEWLCGERPFHGTFAELFSQHLFVAPSPLHTKIPDIPPDIEQVVLMALAKDPQQRFQSVRAFANAFEQACSMVQFQLPSTTGPQNIPPVAPTQTYDLSRTLYQPLAPPPVITPPQSQSTLFPTVPVNSQILSTPQPGREVTTGASTAARTFFTRRSVLAGLAGIATLGSSGLTWLSYNQLRPHSAAPLKHTTTPSPTIISATLGHLLFTYRGHSDWVHSVSWSPNSQRIASGSVDNTLQIWDATTGAHSLTHNSANGVYGIYDVAWSPDGQYIASTARLFATNNVSAVVPVLLATTGNPVFTYTINSAYVAQLAWSQDSARIASAGEEYAGNNATGEVRVWDATTGNHLYTYHGHAGTVDGVAWSPDGKLIASCGNDNTAQVWNAVTGEKIYVYHGHADGVVYPEGWAKGVNHVAWSPDGKLIASAGSDGTVQVWLATTGNRLVMYRGHPGGANSVAWSPDGTRIASTGGDVQLWNVATGERIFSYTGHYGGVYDAAWSPDGKLIASAGIDHTVQVWQAS